MTNDGLARRRRVNIPDLPSQVGRHSVQGNIQIRGEGFCCEARPEFCGNKWHIDRVNRGVQGGVVCLHHARKRLIRHNVRHTHTTEDE